MHEFHFMPNSLVKREKIRNKTKIERTINRRKKTKFRVTINEREKKIMKEKGR